MPDKQTVTTPDSAEQVCRDLPLMMNRCFQVGLFATGHLMHEAVRKAGWELADILKQEKQAAITAKARGRHVKA